MAASGWDEVIGLQESVLRTVFTGRWPGADRATVRDRAVVELVAARRGLMLDREDAGALSYADEAAEIRRISEALRPLADREADPIDHAVAHALFARLWCELHDAFGDDASLNEAERELAECAPGLPPTPWVAAVYTELARWLVAAYRATDDDEAALRIADRIVAAADRAVALSTPEDEHWVARNWLLGTYLYGNRARAATGWRARAIECLTVVVTAGGEVDQETRFVLGNLLQERGVDSGSVEDLRAGAAQLRAAASTGPDGERRWMAGLLDIYARQHLAQRSRDGDDWTEVIVSADRALVLPSPYPGYPLEPLRARFAAQSVLRELRPQAGFDGFELVMAAAGVDGADVDIMLLAPCAIGQAAYEIGVSAPESLPEAIGRARRLADVARRGGPHFDAPMRLLDLLIAYAGAVSGGGPGPAVDELIEALRPLDDERGMAELAADRDGGEAPYRILMRAARRLVRLAPGSGYGGAAGMLSAIGAAREVVIRVSDGRADTVAWMDRVSLLSARLESAVRQGDGAEIERIAAEFANVDPPYDADSEFSALQLRTELDIALTAHRPGDRDLLDRAIAGTGRMLERFEHPAPSLVQTWATERGRLLRTRNGPGDREASRQCAIDATSSATWRVLVQAATPDAIAIATDARFTGEFVTWCAEDGAAEDLVRVLEAQRALALHAAGTDRDVAGRLRARGAHELAARWEKTAGARSGADAGVPSDLREAVLRELGAGRLQPPAVADIQDTLAAAGSDALIYLVPPAAERAALAVTVPREGRVSVSGLPGVAPPEAGTPLGDYVAAYHRWYDTPRTAGSDDAKRCWQEALDRLSGWAGPAAGEEIRRAAAAHGGRVVLVPMGVLGLVPWHAARLPSGRYLLEDVCVSYAPSARMLAGVVRRAPVTGPIVLVGNPEMNLRMSGCEARLLRERFYPDARHLGGTGAEGVDWERAPGGRGTVAEVEELLASGVAIMHVASHALADIDEPHKSHIRLADGNSLTASRLLELDPTGELDIGLGVLSGCTTSLTGTAYDEAFSLSSALLAAGARSVVGSLWAVDDDAETVDLICEFHRCLSAGLAPAEALRRAQLRTLGSGRAGLSDWAAFQHQGR